VLSPVTTFKHIFHSFPLNQFTFCSLFLNISFYWKSFSVQDCCFLLEQVTWHVLCSFENIIFHCFLWTLVSPEPCTADTVCCLKWLFLFFIFHLYYLLSFLSLKRLLNHLSHLLCLWRLRNLLKILFSFFQLLAFQELCFYHLFFSQPHERSLIRW